MIPFEILDMMLNKIQTLPLDAQHYNKLIVTNAKGHEKNYKNFIKLSKKSFVKKKISSKTLKKLSKAEERASILLDEKLKASNTIHKIIKDAFEELKTHMGETEDVVEFTVPSITAIPNIIRTGSRNITDGNGEALYCICRQKSYGDMIGCDSADCQIGWYHFSCVGITTAPKGNWICAQCKRMKTHLRN